MNRKLKSLLIKNGIKQKDIAEKAGVSRVTVSVVMGGHGSSQRIKAVTAELLGISLDKFEKIWERKAA
jgi:transcriptional regulator with XRE-family HTH domain